MRIVFAIVLRVRDEHEQRALRLRLLADDEAGALSHSRVVERLQAEDADLSVSRRRTTHEHQQDQQRRRGEPT